MPPKVRLEKEMLELTFTRLLGCACILFRRSSSKKKNRRYAPKKITASQEVQ